MPTASNGDHELFFDSTGEPDDPVVLLLAGNSLQLLVWDERFCRDLAGRGFRVVRMDNRDVGLSTKTAGSAEAVAALGAAVLAAEHTDVPYTLADMALDGVAVLDALGAERAVVVGYSLGGAVAQRMAIDHRHRVAGLVCVGSSTGRSVPGDPVRVAHFSRAARSREQAIDEDLEIYRSAAGSSFDEGYYRDLAARNFDRADHLRSGLYQTAAVQADGSRRAALAELDVPTLVIHGDLDPWVPLAMGEATAAAVPGAELVVVEGMGHNIDPPSWPALVDAIAGLATRATAG